MYIRNLAIKICFLFLQELLVFATIGVFCGLGGALYVYLHRRYVLWMRGNKRLTKYAPAFLLHI